MNENPETKKMFVHYKKLKNESQSPKSEDRGLAHTLLSRTLINTRVIENNLKKTKTL